MHQKTKILLAFSAISIYLAAFYSVQVFSTENNQLQVSFLDIGQGDAIYIKAPNGRDMLIDGGRTSVTLLKKLRTAMAPGDDTINVILETHPDADHIGGLQSVIENYSVGEFVEPGIPATTKTYEGLLAAVGANQVPHLFGRTGTIITLDEKNSVIFKVFAPSSIYEGEDTNDASIVGILSYGKKKFLLNGDAPIVTEEEIMKKGIDLGVDVLKLGHHGSRTSSSEAFLRATHPNVAVISAGCDNSYGHPHKEVMSRLATLQIPAVSTCASGTITFMTDGDTLSQHLEK